MLIIFWSPKILCPLIHCLLMPRPSPHSPHLSRRVKRSARHQPNHAQHLFHKETLSSSVAFWGKVFDIYHLVLQFWLFAILQKVICNLLKVFNNKKVIFFNFGLLTSLKTLSFSFYPFQSGSGTWFVLSVEDGSGLVGGNVVYNILILKSPKTRENSIFHKEVSGQ